MVSEMGELIVVDGMTMVDDKTMTPIRVGDVREDYRGTKCTITGGKPATKSCCGLVYTLENGVACEHYVGIVDAMWVQL